MTGGSGHGGGQVVSQGSANYQTFSTYMDLLSDDEQPVDPGVLKVTLEEPVKGQVHTCLLYTSPSPRDLSTSRMPSSA